MCSTQSKRVFEYRGDIENAWVTIIVIIIRFMRSGGFVKVSSQRQLSRLIVQKSGRVCVCVRHAEKKTSTIINRRATRRICICVYNTKPKRRQWQNSIHYIVYFIFFGSPTQNVILPRQSRVVYSRRGWCVVCTLNARTASTCCFIIYYNIIIYDPRVVFLNSQSPKSAVLTIENQTNHFRRHPHEHDSVRQRPRRRNDMIPYYGRLWILVILYTIIMIYRIR